MLAKKTKAIFIWTPEAQKAFNEMKAIIAKAVLLHYPDHNEEFHIITDASDYQNGTVIKQNHYSRKLNPAQQNYTTMEKELLSIVETLKEFRTMLYRCKAFHVHKDHWNPTYSTLNSQQLQRWQLFLEEYNPIFHHIKLHEQSLVFRALTTIDTVTIYPEHIRLNNKTSWHVAQQFENSWFSRYPWPIQCIYDQGPEFLGPDFQNLLDEYHIIHRPITVLNLQANAICERVHQTVLNALHPLLHTYPLENVNDVTFIIDTALSTAAYSMRSAIHSTLKISPGALVFHRDMFLDIPIITDVHILQQQHQALIDKNLMRANHRCISHDYQPNDEVLRLLAYKPNTLDPRATAGPFAIHSVHTNGTNTINHNPDVREWISIRRVWPYYRE
jgi:transposase InsO family protein